MSREDVSHRGWAGIVLRVVAPLFRFPKVKVSRSERWLNPVNLDGMDKIAR